MEEQNELNKLKAESFDCIRAIELSQQKLKLLGQKIHEIESKKNDPNN